MKTPNTSLFPMAPNDVIFHARKRLISLDETQQSLHRDFTARLKQWEDASWWHRFFYERPYWIKQEKVFPNLSWDVWGHEKQQHHECNEIAELLGDLMGYAENTFGGSCWLCKKDMEALGL